MTRRGPLPGVLALSILAAAAAAAQTQPPPGFTEKVEVNVRTVLAVVTDAKGKPIERPLSVEEVEVLEDGVPAKVLGVDVVRPAKTVGSASGRDLQGTEASPVPPPEMLARVPQVLYLDASLLQKKSVKKVCEMMAKNLDALLARGPLEIVLADPEPKTVLPSTADSAPVRLALASLTKTGQGRDRLLDVRADFIPGANSVKSKGRDLDALERRMHARASIQEEVHLVRQSLERLGKWAGLREDRRPAVLYLASDGFDLVLSDFYRDYLQGTDGEQLRMEFVPQIPNMVAQTESALANQGLMTVALAIGGAEAFLGNSPSVVGKRPVSDLRNSVSDAPTFLFVRPLDPLREIAGATGGEVVTRADHFALALDRLSNAVAITYRMNRPPNGRVHKLEVKTTRRGVTLRAAQSILDAPELVASAQSAVQALESLPASGTLPVDVFVDLLEVKPDKRRVGDVQVSVDLGPILEALEKVGPGRMRVALAVRAPGMQPFVHHEEVDLAREGEGSSWTYAFPLEWPPEATRVALTIEELKTATRGTAAADLPATATEPAAPAALPGMLSSARARPELPLEITLSDVKRSMNDITLRLHAKIGIEPIFEALSNKGRGRVQIIVVSESPAGRTQLANLERSVAFDITVDSWTMEIPVTCSVNAMRLIVTVAELESGGHAVASVDPARSR